MKNSRLPYLLPIRSIIFILIFLLGSIFGGKELSDITNWWTILATVVNFITIFILVIAAKKNGMSYLELINYRKGTTKVKEVVLISIMILLVGMGGMYLAGYLCYGVIPYASPMMIEPVAITLAVINVFLLPVTTALAEEGLYLGCGVNRIENKAAGIIVPAFFYALQHCFIPVLLDGRYFIYRFISYLPLTIILCCYYQKKKNPVPIMIGHAIIDLMTVAWVLATSMVPGFYETMCNMAK